MKLWRPFKEFSPVMKAAALMIPASLTIILSYWLMPVSPDARELLAHYYQTKLQSWKNVIDFTVFTPFQEEAIYRWPSLLLLIVLLRRVELRPTKLRIGIAYCIASGIMIAMTAYWASFHDYPLTVFCYGMVWGWLIFYTKNPFYSWMFHGLSNAFSIAFIVAGHHLLY
ncbi:MAG: CPBP family glutamic-type intramembrane protease [bacterium]|nr:CPBP family glutamic-type intramembrane protease [bacterium]